MYSVLPLERPCSLVQVRVVIVRTRQQCHIYVTPWTLNLCLHVLASSGPNGAKQLQVHAL